MSALSSDCCARASGQGDRQLHAIPRPHFDLAPNEHETDDRHAESAGPRQDGELEAAVRARQRRLPGALVEDGHSRNGGSGRGIDDRPRNRSGREVLSGRFLQGLTADSGRCPDEDPDRRQASTSSNHGKFKTVIGPTKRSADDRPGGGKCLKNVRHTACSIGGCERPEYLRQGAVSCWGAGSPAKTMGIVIMAMPFFSALTLVPHDALHVRLPLLQDTAAPTAVPSPATPLSCSSASMRLRFRTADRRSGGPTAR